MEQHHRQGLTHRGIRATASDPCIFTKGIGIKYIVLTLFVDDLLITGPSNQCVAETRIMPMAKLATTDLGDVSQVLGIEVKRDKKARTIELNQGNYTLSVLKHFNIEQLQSGAHAGNRKGAYISTGRQRTSGQKATKDLSSDGKNCHLSDAVYEVRRGV